MLHKIEELESRFDELESLLADPSVLGNQVEFRRLSKEHYELSALVSTYRDYKKIVAQMDDNRELLNEADPEMREMAEAELEELEGSRERLEEEIKLLLLPKDPNDDRSVVLEIRAGTGGDEAALFAGDLFRMYSRYAESNRWKVDIISSSESALGGFKEIVALVEGGKVCMPASSMNPEPIACSGFRTRRPRGASTPAPALSRFFRKRRISTSISIRPT